MNAFRYLLFAGLAAVLFGVLPTNAHAQLLEERMQVTFSSPVEVPGEVLPAGTYTFEALKNGTMTRILSADEKHVYATLMTVPEERLDPVQNRNVVLDESSKGSPERVG